MPNARRSPARPFPTKGTAVEARIPFDAGRGRRLQRMRKEEEKGMRSPDRPAQPGLPGGMSAIESQPLGVTPRRDAEYVCQGSSSGRRRKL